MMLLSTYYISASGPLALEHSSEVITLGPSALRWYFTEKKQNFILDNGKIS